VEINLDDSQVTIVLHVEEEENAKGIDLDVSAKRLKVNSK